MARCGAGYLCDGVYEPPDWIGYGRHLVVGCSVPAPSYLIAGVVVADCCMNDHYADVTINTCFLRWFNGNQ